MKTITKIRLVLLTFPALFCSVLFCFTLYGNAKRNHIIETGVETVGHISNSECGNKGSVEYAYFVGGQKYIGRGSKGLKASCWHSNIGDPVNIIYSTTNPSLSLSGTASDYENSLSTSILFLILFMLMSIIFIFKFTMGIRRDI